MIRSVGYNYFGFNLEISFVLEQILELKDIKLTVITQPSEMNISFIRHIGVYLVI